jgi:hypothetical protein
MRESGSVRVVRCCSLTSVSITVYLVTAAVNSFYSLISKLFGISAN